MKLKIKLCSDLCTSSGDTYNSFIDTDVEFNEKGFPVIPAKRIKGCIREAALELVEFGAAEKSDYDALFGMEGIKNGKFTLDTAYLEDYNSLIEDLDHIEKSNLATPQNVLSLYTYTRSQTAMENGVAKENSLRTARVVRKNLTFEALLTVEPDISEEQKKLLQNSASMVKHIGSMRTRGLGQVELSIEESDIHSENNNPGVVIPKGKSDDLLLLNYKISLKAPVICKSEKGNQGETETYISGSKVLGILIGQMGQDKYRSLPENAVLQVSNAYLEIAGKRGTPVSKSLQKVKDTNYITTNDNDPAALKVWDLLFGDAGNQQMTPVGGCYVTKDGFSGTVKTEIRYHHKRPDNKAKGKPDGNDNSSFYQLESVSEGQVFCGHILADRETAQLLAETIKEKTPVRIGAGRRTEYGSAVFEWTGCHLENEEMQAMAEECTLKFNAPVILYNEYGVPDASVSVLADYLGRILDAKVTVKDLFAEYDTIGGYNVTWNARKPVFTAIGAGTVCRITMDRQVDTSLLRRAFVGERTREGYGEIELYSDEKAEKFLYHENTKRFPKKGYEKQTKLLENLEYAEEKRQLQADGRKEADNSFEKYKLKEKEGTDAVVGRLILMYHGENTFENFNGQIKEIKTESKKKAAEELVGPVEKYLQDRQRGNCRVTNEEAYKLFTGAYLEQIKYRRRSK